MPVPAGETLVFAGARPKNAGDRLITGDKLVLDGWDPGDGRTRPLPSHDEFARKMREWIKNGAAEPE